MTKKLERLEELEKQIDANRIQRLQLWSQEDAIKKQLEMLQKRNNELVTEFLKIKLEGYVPIPLRGERP